MTSTDTHIDEGDALRIPFARAVVWVQAVAMGASVFLLFVAMLTAPVEMQLFGGLLGARAVWLYSVVAGLFALQLAWLRTSSIYASSTGIPRPDEDLRRDIWAWCTFFLLFLAAIAAFGLIMRGLWHYGLVHGHDSPQYYAYLHSWVFDRDLKFENELRAIPGAWELMVNAHPEQPDYNVAPIGTAVLWLPFYLIAHAVIVALNTYGGTQLPSDGLQAPYAMAAAFGSIFCVWLGLCLCYAATRRYFAPRAALFACLLTAFATQLLWYVTDQVWMSHACSFFGGAFAFWAWTRWRFSRSHLDAALLGLAIGVAMLVRPTHVALFALPLVDIVLTARDRGKVIQSLLGFLLTAGVSVVVFVPQLATWYLRSGAESPPGSPMMWATPALIRILFSPQSGLFAWHPVVFAGVLGIPFLWRRSRGLCLGIAAVLLIYWYLNAAIESWWGGGSFGMRRFVGTLPFIVPGIAMAGTLAVRFCRRYSGGLVWAVVLLLLGWNSLMVLEHRQGYVPLHQPKTFEIAWTSAATIIHSAIGSPTTYPASLWFAWQHGVSPGRYDLLSGWHYEPYLAVRGETDGPDADPRTMAPLERGDLKYFLGRGWYSTIADLRLYRGAWVAHTRNPTLLLPMRKTWVYDLELTLMPPPGMQGAQVVQFSLNGHDLGTAELVTENKTTVSLRIPAEASRDYVNTLEMALAQEYETYRDIVEASQRGAGLPVATRKPYRQTIWLWDLKLVPVE